MDCEERAFQVVGTECARLRQGRVWVWGNDRNFSMGGARGRRREGKVKRDVDKENSLWPLW